MNKDIIERAKQYAKKENKSLSKLVGDYFSKLSADQEYTIEITPLVKRLSKVAKVQSADVDHKKSYADYLSKKYSK